MARRHVRHSNSCCAKVAPTMPPWPRWALGEIEDSASAPALIRALRSPHTPVRLAAVGRAWQHRIREDARPEIERLLRDDVEEPARRRRFVPPLFPHRRRRAHGGADGCAAAARGPAPVHRGGRMACSAGLSAPPILARDLDRGLLLLGDFGDDAAARDARRRSAARARPLRLATDVLVHFTVTRRCRAQAPRPRPVARRTDALYRLVLPGCRAGVDAELSRRRGAKCWCRSPATGSGR